MSPRTEPICHLFLRQMRSVRFFFLVSCMSFAFSILWVQYATRQDQPVNDSLIQEALHNVARDFRYKDMYRKSVTLPDDFKYILLWAHADYAPFYYFGEGQRIFLQNNCSQVKCYVTTDRQFHGNLTKFDVIMFNGRVLHLSDLPTVRSPHQRYVYVNSESAVNQPVCNSKFDSFFNWTYTYRLDSDIPYPYILIRDSENEIVGPKRIMHWKKPVEPEIDEDLAYTIKNKTKAAAWFVSNCKNKKRNKYVKDLQIALKNYGHTVDVYGMCGHLKCSTKEQPTCNDLLKRDYFFYMAMENSFAADYISEKVLTALNNDVVPIVFGGANYSRFLPPSSYIEAHKHSPQRLAAVMSKLINSNKEYSKYFWWKSHYTFHHPETVENVCALCEALHDKKMMETPSIYEHFRYWWLPKYSQFCVEHRRR